MKNVTGQMQRFKEASRHIWNCYLMPGEGVLDMAVEDSFLQIERELLRSMVLEGSAAADQYGHSAIGGLIVKPKPLHREVPVQSSAGGSSTTRDDRTANMDTSRRRRCADAGTNRI